MSFPARWNDDGLVINTRGNVPPPLGRRTRDRDPLDMADVYSIGLRWREITTLAAIDPWPRLSVAWHYKHQRQEQWIAPTMMWRDSALRFEQGVEELFAHAERFLRTSQLRRGWLDAPLVAWEEVAEMPGNDGPRPIGDGGYRTAAGRAVEPVVARRTPPSPLEGMLCWLASGPERPWREAPREIVLTEEHLVARRPDGKVCRLPLSALRVRYGYREPPNDAFYVFGRRTMVLLTQRASCPVRARLDALLLAD